MTAEPQIFGHNQIEQLFDKSNPDLRLGNME